VTPKLCAIVRHLIASRAAAGGDAAPGGWSALVFAGRKVTVAALARLLQALPAAAAAGLVAEPFYGNTADSRSGLGMDSSQQGRLIAAFREGRFSVMVATGARGAGGLGGLGACGLFDIE
jgi:ERCC4-related helicase